MSVLINSRGTLSNNFAVGQNGMAVDGNGVVTPPDNEHLSVQSTLGFGLSINSGNTYGLLTTDTGWLKLQADVVDINGVQYPNTPGLPGQVLTSNGFGLVEWTTAGAGSVTSVAGEGSVNGITLTGTVTSNGQLTLGGQLSVYPSNFGIQTAGTVLSVPPGANDYPVFRVLESTDIPVLNQDTTGSAAALTTARNISMTGDASWTVSFDGTSDVTSLMQLTDTGVESGTYTKITVDSRGRVLTGETPNTLAGYGITDAVSSTGATMSGALNYASIVDVPSGNAISLLSYDGNIVRITGTTDIADFGTAASGAVRRLIFADGLTLLNGSALVLPGGVNLQVSAGDIVEFIGTDLGWVCSGLTRAAQLPTGEFTNTGTGAVSRSIVGRLQEVFSVKDYGARGDGVTDDTSAFSKAAIASASIVNIVGAESSLPRAKMSRVRIPEGVYLLTQTVDTGNKEIIWDIDPAAKVLNHQYLNGEVYRAGQRQADAHHGTTDYACSYSIRSNGDLEDGAEVLGITSPAQLAQYTDRDTVSLYVDNIAPAALVTTDNASYTATTVIIPAPDTETLKRYRRGMIIDTKHTPKWSGILDSWNADGSVLTVTGWYTRASGTTPGVPDNTAGCVLNGFTKAWAHNANITLTADSHATRACGFELGVFNNRAPLDFATEMNYIWGYDAVSLGTHDGAVGYISRTGTSRFYRSFQSNDAIQAGFYSTGTPSFGFLSEQTAGTPFQFNKGGTPLFYVDNSGLVVSKAGLKVDSDNGNLSLGGTALASTPHIDFNSSGISVDYDTRISSTGGTATPGQGSLHIEAGAGAVFTGGVLPDSDNTQSVGSAVNRWAQIYAGAGTINTSDFNDKQDIRELAEVELRVAKRLKNLVRVYRFKDAVTTKGPNARMHVGVIAQEVRLAFEAEGLDADDYGVLCYDSWPEQSQEVETWDAEYDDAGNLKREAGFRIVRPARPAGGRYGVRYDELLAFIISAV